MIFNFASKATYLNNDGYHAATTCGRCVLQKSVDLAMVSIREFLYWWNSYILKWT